MICPRVTKFQARSPAWVPKTYDSYANFWWMNDKIPCLFCTCEMQGGSKECEWVLPTSREVESTEPDTWGYTELRMSFWQDCWCTRCEWASVLPCLYSSHWGTGTRWLMWSGSRHVGYRGRWSNRRFSKWLHKKIQKNTYRSIGWIHSGDLFLELLTTEETGCHSKQSLGLTSSSALK